MSLPYQGDRTESDNYGPHANLMQSDPESSDRQLNSRQGVTGQQRNGRETVQVKRSMKRQVDHLPAHILEDDDYSGHHSSKQTIH